VTLDNTSGEVETWKPAAPDDSLSLKLTAEDGLPGAVMWYQIRFDYTFPDGTSGETILSDKMVKYSGSFFGPWPGEDEASCVNGNLDSSWAIYTQLAPDLTKVSVTRAVLTSSNGDTITLGADSVSFFNPVGDNPASAACSAAGLSLDPSYDWDLELTLNYSDGALDWTDVHSMTVAISGTFGNPTLDSASAEPADDGSSYIPFTVTVNSGAVNGDMTATLQRWTGGEDYETFTGGSGTVNTLTLPKGSTGTWETTSSGDCLAADLAAENGYDIVRVAVAYTGSDGSIKYLYSDPMAVYKGTYISPIPDSGVFGDNMFGAEFQIDTDIVDIDYVSGTDYTVKVYGSFAGESGEKDITGDLEAFVIDREEGTVLVRGKVRVDDVYPSSAYVELTLNYNDTTAPAQVQWQGTARQSILSVYPYLYDSSVTDYGPTDDTVWLTFDLEDLDEVAEITAYLLEYDPDTESYEIAEGGVNGISPTTLPISSWVTYVSEGNDCLRNSFEIPDMSSGVIKWYKLYVEFTLNNGTQDSITSEPMALYKGDFFAQHKDSDGLPTVTYTDDDGGNLDSWWELLRDVDADSVSVNSIVLVPVNAGVASVDITDTADTYFNTEGLSNISASELILDTGSAWNMQVSLTCTMSDPLNEGVDCRWTSRQTVPVYMDVYIPIPPLLDSASKPVPTDDANYRFPFSVITNDAAVITAQVYISDSENGEFTAVGDAETYDANERYEDVWTSAVYFQNTATTTRYVKIEFTYEFWDGSSGDPFYSQTFAIDPNASGNTAPTLSGDPEIEDGLDDYFSVPFTVVTNDASTIEANLLSSPRKNGDYTVYDTYYNTYDVSEGYSAEWDGYFSGKYSRLAPFTWFKFSFAYTLPSGDSGTLVSEPVLFSKGNFFTEESDTADYDADKQYLSCTFSLDDSLVPLADDAAVTLVGAVLSDEAGDTEIPSDDISLEIDGESGSIRFSATELEISDGNWWLVLTLNYSDGEISAEHSVAVEVQFLLTPGGAGRPEPAADPAAPADPTDAVGPEEADPEKPTEPVEPAEPAEPVEPIGPAEPEDHDPSDDPEDPDDPDAPDGSEDPGESDDPEESDTP
jgi:hypothetical protein